MKFDPENAVRKNIRRLKPYSSARTEFDGRAEIFLDANENGFGSPLERNFHRYPDPLQTKIKEKLAVGNAVAPDEIFIGNGSDEAIDLLFRIFCEPRKDAALICPPTYGIYGISAAINDVEIKKAFLTADFELDPEAIRREIGENTKLIFFCSPNNPTGRSLDRNAILEIAESFRGIVVVDEAYIHFSREKSLVPEIRRFKNLVVLQTFSKAWGLAGLRVGAAFADSRIIDFFNRVKPPYNVSGIAQETVLAALKNNERMEATVAAIICEREKLTEKLKDLPFVEKIYPSDANFVLIKTNDAERIYKFLLAEKIVVRNRSRVEMCAGCLRLTVGTPWENECLIDSLKKFARE
jgi:histidinol-phosphate aminotransferase